MNIGIIGGGVVGSATARAFVEHVDKVLLYDVDPLKSTTPLQEVITDSHILFLCLPENQVESFVVNNLPHYDNPIVIKSTVPIGFTRQLNERMKETSAHGMFVHSPEFLTERTATFDASCPSRLIIGFSGGGYSKRGVVTDFMPYAGGPVKALGLLYQRRFPHVPIQVMSSDESEAVKLMTNAFYAVKIAFWNEMRTLADGLELDWNTVMEGILSGGRIHPSHTMVPGPDGERGFGGKCLPKDLYTVINSLSEQGLHSHVCWATSHYARGDKVSHVEG